MSRGRTRMDIVNDALEELRQKYPTLFTSNQYSKRVVGVLNRSKGVDGG